MQFVEFSKLYNNLLKKLKDKIILWKNLPCTDNYTNTQDINIQNISIQDTWLGLMPVNAALRYQTATTGDGTIILDLD